MKTRRTIIMILTLCVALSFTACTGKGDVGKADSSSVSEGTEKTEDLQAKLDDLYQQENEIFENRRRRTASGFEHYIHNICTYRILIGDCDINTLRNVNKKN